MRRSFPFLLASRSPRHATPPRGRDVAPREAKDERARPRCFGGDDTRDGAAAALERVDRQSYDARGTWRAAERGTVLALERWQNEPGSVATAVVVRQVRGGES